MDIRGKKYCYTTNRTSVIKNKILTRFDISPDHIKTLHKNRFPTNKVWTQLFHEWQDIKDIPSQWLNYRKLVLKLIKFIP